VERSKVVVGWSERQSEVNAKSDVVPDGAGVTG
jgi:hypothetical protein